MVEPNHRHNYVPAMTGLRFFAAIMVVLHHTGLPLNWPTPIRAAGMNGYAGVTLFFILSGFVLSLNYYEKTTKPSARAMWNFAIARVARIMPVYWVVLGYAMYRYRSNGIPIIDGWKHALALQAWSDDVVRAFGLNGPGWSISVEMFLYLCFPVIVVVSARMSSARSIFTVMVMTTMVLALVTAWFAATGRGALTSLDPNSAHRWLYRSPPLRLFDFTLGVLAARLVVFAPSVRRWSAVLTWFGIVSAVFLTTRMEMFFDVWSWDAGYVLSFLAVIVGIAAGGARAVNAVLGSKPLVLLGEASFALYLVHTQVFNYMGLPDWADTGSNPVWHLLLILGAALGVAVGLHWVVERPAQRLLRSLLSVRVDRTMPVPTQPTTTAA